MKSNSAFITMLIFLHFCGFAFAAINKAWIDRSAGLTEGKVNCLYVGGSSRNFLLAGTDKALYRSDNSRKFFQPVLQLYGNFKAIHQIQSDITDVSTLYSATDAGVFVSHDQGLSWENIFNPSHALARKVFCVLADQGTVYAGTADGLYIRLVGQVTWEKKIYELNDGNVLHLADGGDDVYAATETEVFRLKKNEGELKKVLTSMEQHIEEQGFDEDGESAAKVLIKDLVSVNKGKQVFVVMGRELLVSEDRGENWDNWITENLPVDLVQRLFVGDAMYAATEKGIFAFENDRWEQDVAGLSSDYVYDIAINADGDIFLATMSGVYTKGTGGRVVGNINYNDISKYFKTEPTIKDVQKMAIEYANVNPSQIKSWHNQSRAKAFFPSLSVGLNRADTDLIHWDTGPNPDVMTKGRDYLDWSTSLSWDFSDFVWSSDHTSIDSRAKLMSELRQDILEQVTRLYFERRRIQIELVSVKDTDWDREMRIEELTALIDSLTGGEFSRRINKDSPVSQR